MTDFLRQEPDFLTSGGLDLATFGQRLRHLRRSRGLTLAELGSRVGRAPSALSLLENGRREPKLSLIVSTVLPSWNAAIPSGRDVYPRVSGQPPAE